MVQEAAVLLWKRALEEQNEEETDEEDYEELLKVAGAVGVMLVGCKTCRLLIHKLKKLGTVAYHHKCAMLKQKSPDQSTKEHPLAPSNVKTPAENMASTLDRAWLKSQTGRQIKVKQLHVKAAIPTKSTEAAAGYELRNPIRVKIASFALALIKTRLSMAIPSGYYGK